MTRSHLLAAALGVLLGVLLSLFVVAGAASRSAHPGVPLVSSAVRAGQSGAPQNVGANGSGEHKAGAAGTLPSRHGVASPATESGAPQPTATVDGPPAPSANPRRTKVGIASRYWGSRGWHGVPHVALPGARWTGGVWGWARVCVVATGLCDVFPVVDRCGCVVGVSRRIVDLSAEAVAALDLDPARGLYRVTVESWRTP